MSFEGVPIRSAGRSSRAGGDCRVFHNSAHGSMDVVLDLGMLPHEAAS